MTKVLSLELSPHIQVNSVAPGRILKPKAGTNKNLYKNIHNSKDGIKSLLHAINFLLDSNFISGESINIDKGERFI